MHATLQSVFSLDKLHVQGEPEKVNPSFLLLWC